jgi:hypothetical protein
MDVDLGQTTYNRRDFTSLRLLYPASGGLGGQAGQAHVLSEPG